MTQQVNKQIQGAVGVHAVYLAVLHDEQLQDSFIYRRDTKDVIYNGKRMLERDFASVSVYLAGKYEMRVTGDELRTGIVAAAAVDDKPKRKRGGKMRPRESMVSAIANWLEDNRPSFANHEITTEVVGETICPAEWAANRRRAEMEIGAAMRECGLVRHRITVNGDRKWRWYARTK